MAFLWALWLPALTHECIAQTAGQPYPTAVAPEPAMPQQPGENAVLTVGAAHHDLSGGYGLWRGVYARLGLRVNQSDALAIGLERAERFNETGTLGSVQWNHDLNADWQTIAVYAATTDGTFWPASFYRLGIARKWLEGRNLVTTLLAGYNVSRNGYRDRLFEASGAWYTASKFVFEAGLRWNHSNPGSVDTQRAFAAVTYGEPHRYYLTLRGSSGREGYQLLRGTSIVDFHSSDADLIWRQWVTRTAGFEARLTGYRNPFYSRRAIDVGLFVEF